MNAIVYGSPSLPILASATSLRHTCPVRSQNVRSLITPSKSQEQQLQTNDNSVTSDASLLQTFISANNTSKETGKTNRKTRKEKATRKAVRRLRVLQTRAAESTSKSVQERTLASVSKVLDEWLAVNEPKKKLSYNNQPSSDDKDEWRRAMHRLLSIFRKGNTNDHSLDYKINSTAKERFKFEETESGENRKSDSPFTDTHANEDGHSNQTWRKFASNAKASKASINAQVTEQARQSQPEVTPSEKTTTGSTFPPGLGLGAIPPPPFQFEKTAMHYPPADRYPPPLPLVRELDLDLAARALRINRACDVHWVPGKGNDHSDGKEAGGAWRKIMHGPDHWAQKMDADRMDTGQGLEYLGDSVLHLVSRACIMEKFPRRSMFLYNLAANWIVSNDVFGHIYVDAGLVGERNFIADILLNSSKERQLEEMRSTLTPEEFQLRQNAPLPAQQLPILNHLRQADLFEGYVGAIFLTFGYQKAAQWCSALLEPWLDRVARTRNFLSSSSLTQAGEVRARIEEQIREEVRKEYEQRLQAEQGGTFTFVTKWLRSTFERNKGD